MNVKHIKELRWIGWRTRGCLNTGNREFPPGRRPQSLVSTFAIVTPDVSSMQMIRWLSQSADCSHTVAIFLRQHAQMWPQLPDWSPAEKLLIIWTDARPSCLMSLAFSHSVTVERREGVVKMHVYPLSKVLLIINESFCHLSSKHAKNSFSLSVNTLKLWMTLFLTSQRPKHSINQCRKRLKSQTI